MCVCLLGKLSALLRLTLFLYAHSYNLHRVSRAEKEKMFTKDLIYWSLNGVQNETHTYYRKKFKEKKRPIVYSLQRHLTLVFNHVFYKVYDTLCLI